MNEGSGHKDNSETVCSLSDEFRAEFMSVVKVTASSVGALGRRKSVRCAGRRLADGLLKDVDAIICEQFESGEGSLWNLNHLVYAGTHMVTRKINRPKTDGRAKIPTLSPKQISVAKLRQQLGWVTNELKRREAKIKLSKRQAIILGILRKMYRDTSNRNLKCQRETLLVKLRVRAKQVRCQKIRKRRKDVDERYRRDSPSSLEKGAARSEFQGGNYPTADQVKDYWQSVIGVPGAYHPEDPFVARWRDSVKDVPESEVTLGYPMFLKAVKKARSWKAAGNDCVRAFWWKVFPGAARILWKLLSEMIEGNRDIPAWFVKGRTVLIPKEGCQGKPEQYRPITCLNTGYKLLTSVLTGVLQEHLENSGILPDEQKALRKGRRGCLDALVIDSMIIRETKLRRMNLSVAWIDYKKAYDRVPHGWLERVLEYIHAPEKVRHCLSRLIPLWETEFSIRSGTGTARASLTLKRGLFQGDSLSPLLFCLCIVPLSHALRSIGIGYKCKDVDLVISHQLYMDDLKVYTKSSNALTHALSVVDRVSTAVGMELGLRKCAVAHMQRGKLVESEDFLLDEDRVITSVTEGQTYRYLGIEQVFDPDHKTIREKLERAYVKRLRRIWSSDLNSKHKVRATNGWAVPVFRYFFNHVKWGKKYLLSLDRKTRSVIRQHGGHYYGASLERLYLPRAEGGRGLTSLAHTWEREVVSAAAYLMRAKDKHLEAVRIHQLWLANNNKHSNVKDAQEVLNHYELSDLLENTEGSNVSTKRATALVKTAQFEAMSETLAVKKIHGVFYTQCTQSGDLQGCTTASEDGGVDCGGSGWCYSYSSLPSESTKENCSTRVSGVRKIG